MAPRKAYLEFEAQPARITPYTPTEVSDSTYSRPASTLAITRSGSIGITAQMAKAGISVITGASRNSTLLELAGIDHFLDQQLDDVGEGLKDARQDAEEAHAVWSLAHLHPADDLALPQRDERHAEDQEIVSTRIQMRRNHVRRRTRDQEIPSQYRASSCALASAIHGRGRSPSRGPLQ